MGDYLKQIAGAGLLLVGLVGYKFYDKTSTHPKLKAEISGLCGDDNACQNLIAKHYDVCFDQSYDILSFSRDMEQYKYKFVECLNKEAGETVFSIQ